MATDNRPNTILPNGAKPIEPRTVTVGSTLPQVVDAAIMLDGILWYRIQRGFGGRGDREDWIANIPALSVSVSDYHWNGEDLGSYGTFENACRQQLISALEYGKQIEQKKKEELKDIESAITMLTCSTLQSTRSNYNAARLLTSRAEDPRRIARRD